MTIKEVEEQVNLKKANIRFYEEQGLLTPQRNIQNNYREYRAEDVETLKKIKCLRVLGVSVEDIRKLQREEVVLSTLMQKRVESYSKEAKEIEIMKNLCIQLKKRSSSFEDIDIAVVDSQNEFVSIRGKKVLRLDKIYRIDKYEGTILKAWLILFVCYFPLAFATKIAMNMEVPQWLQLPYYTFMVATVITVFILRYRVRRIKSVVL